MYQSLFCHTSALHKNNITCLLSPYYGEAAVKSQNRGWKKPVVLYDEVRTIGINPVVSERR